MKHERMLEFVNLLCQLRNSYIISYEAIENTQEVARALRQKLPGFIEGVDGSHLRRTSNAVRTSYLCSIKSMALLILEYDSMELSDILEELYRNMSRDSASKAVLASLLGALAEKSDYARHILSEMKRDADFEVLSECPLSMEL